MFWMKTSALTVAVMALAASVPLQAQPRTPAPNAVPELKSGTNVPDETIAKAGAAFKQVSDITDEFSKKAVTARSETERQALGKQAKDSVEKAVADHGLTIDQYNSVIRLAQADADIRERLISAAYPAR